MKREELNDYYYYEDTVMTPANHLHRVYHADEVDHLLDEKDAEIAELKQKLEDVNELIKTARQMLEDAKATAYADSVDAGMRERRLQRALWLARAERAKEMCRRLLIQGFDPKWENVERKCRNKAEEYR